MAIFSFGNRKLPKSIAIFNLPRLLTCKNPTELCKDICYAKKAERKCYPRCYPQRMNNYRLSLQYDFVDVITNELNMIKQRLIRIHESGDFYSQTYLDKWFVIMRRFPNKNFTAYSKSILDFSDKPDNFILFFSIDESTERSNAMWYRNNPYKDAIAEIGDENYNCFGNCRRYNCLQCYNKDFVHNIVLKKH